MPELPEVETVKNALLKSIKNKAIKDVFIYRKNIIKNDENEFKKFVIGKTIEDIKRQGKYLIFILSGSKVIVSHLRMEGKFIPGNSIKEKSIFARVVFLFNDGTILNFDDSRTFGEMRIANKDNYYDEPPLSLLGPDANTDFNKELIYEKIINSKKSIKEVLLDQHIIAGLGNIYVDEVLFRSKITPDTDAKYITKNEFFSMCLHAREVLNESIKEHGTTVFSFTFDKGHTGNFQSKLKVYGRKNQPCVVCGTRLVKVKLAGRGTTYCPHCQKRKKEKFIIGITGPVSSGKSTALKIFKDNNFVTISCDELVNELYKNYSFLETIFNLTSAKNKDEMRKIFITNPTAKKEAEKYIHTIIRSKILSIIKKSSSHNFAIEIPLLFQSNFENICDETILILSKNNKEFIKERGKIGEAQYKINNELNYEKYKPFATFVIENNSTLNAFKNNVEKIINKSLL